MNQSKKAFQCSDNTPQKTLHNTQKLDKKGVIQYGVGFDVHRDTIAVCVAAQLATGDIIEVKNHEYGATPKSIEEIISFVMNQSSKNLIYFNLKLLHQIVAR